MLNKVQIIGRLGKEPELKATSTGDLLILNIATSERWKDKNGQQQERTEWHRVNMFGQYAKTAHGYLRKGSLVFVEGKLQTRSWQDNGVKKYATEIIAVQIKYLADYNKPSAEPSFNTSEDVPF